MAERSTDSLNCIGDANGRVRSILVKGAYVGEKTCDGYHVSRNARRRTRGGSAFGSAALKDPVRYFAAVTMISSSVLGAPSWASTHARAGGLALSIHTCQTLFISSLLAILLT